ncbi:MAG TPA: CopD family protein [Rhizomicrobium sp.]|nr:CopD family protein [Rhizomicrobium sp.]
MNELDLNGVILAGARGLYYCAAMTLFGELAFSLLLRVKLPVILPQRNRVLRWSALALAFAASLAWLAAASAEMAGIWNLEALAQTVTATLFGQMLAGRMVALMGLALALGLRHGTKAAVSLAAIALVLPAATSHAAASAGFAILGAALDAAHLLTAGFWLGGLAALALLFRHKEPNILLALSLFSEVAMVAVLLLVMTGLIDAASILLGDKSAASFTYLAVLGVKLALVAVMLVLAAINRFRLMPQSREGTIARNASAELGLGIIVVLLAGVLGQLPPTL